MVFRAGMAGRFTSYKMVNPLVVLICLKGQYTNGVLMILCIVGSSVVDVLGGLKDKYDFRR